MATPHPEPDRARRHSSRNSRGVRPGGPPDGGPAADDPAAGASCAYSAAFLRAVCCGGYPPVDGLQEADELGDLAGVLHAV
jgi:hypothetical protein